jgi:hypothetical protein
MHLNALSLSHTHTHTRSVCETQVIRPSTPTQSITLSFTSLRLSQRYLVDVLYVLPDCNRLTTVHNLNSILTDAMYGAHVLNGNGKVSYGATGVPCDVTFLSSCIIVELEMSRRFVYSETSRDELTSRGIEPEPEEDYSLLSGFTASYKSSPEAQGKPSIWPEGGSTLVCKPAYMSVEQPKPKFVWKELCCSQEDGNEARSSCAALCILF